MHVSPESRVLAVLPELLVDLAQQRSAATVRQRDWALTSALEHHAAGGGTRALAAVTVADLLDPHAVEDYLQAAQTGTLRSRAPAQRPNAESSRSLAARISALRWLARCAGCPQPEPYRDDDQLTPVNKDTLTHARHAIAVLSSREGDFFAIRAAAVMAVMWATGLPAGMLHDLRVDQLHRRPGQLYLTVNRVDPLPRTWQPASSPDTAWAYLPPFAADAVDLWLKERRVAVAQLQGSDHGFLFVSGRANAGRTPPGVKLQARGLQRAHKRTIEAFNGISDQPAPTGLDVLRRAAWTYVLGPDSSSTSTPASTSARRSRSRS